MISRRCLKKSNRLLCVLLMILLAAMLAACGTAQKDTGTAEAEGGQEEAQEQPTVEIVKSIDEVDTEDMHEVPLQIESITLFEDGSLRIVPTEDLLKNAETNNEVVDGAIYPFADSGKVKDFYLVRYGNGGFRTIICLMDDGSLSALSAKELINDHITIVWDNLTGRDTYVSVKEVEREDGYGVVGITEDDEEIDLDFSLDF